MKKILLVAAMIAAVCAAAIVLVLLHVRSRRPEALLDQLARGKGDREDIIMRLNLARGDVVGPMVEALNDRNSMPAFRADLVELLFRRYVRAPDEQIEKAILAVAADPETLVRRQVAHGLATFADEQLQINMLQYVTDPDPDVRRQVYLMLSGSGRRAKDGIWKLMSPEQHAALIEDCLRQVGREEDPEMLLLVRSVIGREIELRAEEATQALQASDVAKAEEILRGALELDPQSAQAKVRLVRFYFMNGQKEKALALGRETGALIEVPELPEAPRIDGDPTDEVWNRAYRTNRFYRTTCRWIDRPTAGKSAAYVGHRDGKIYIAVIGYETEEDLLKLVLNNTTRDSSVWRDDCAELIFDPGNTGKDYWQFCINAVGGLYDSANGNVGKNFNCQVAGEVFQDRGYWACEFAIDGEELGGHAITAGAVWSLNLFRTRIGPASEQSGIWPPYGRAHSMDIYPLALFK